MKKFLMTAAAMMMIFSCTKKDDLLKEQEKGNGTVGVKTEVSNGTRGIALNSNTDLIASQNGFDLYAYQSNGNIFMGDVTDGVEFQYENGWDYADAGEVAFWQQVAEGNTVDFYAVSPANLYSTGYGTQSIGYDYENGAQIIEYTVPTMSNEQMDLMYAKTPSVNPDDISVINNGVQLDFYHALSQIVFSARVHDEDVNHITATVTGVDICNLYGSGVFTFKNAPYGEYGDATEYTPWTYNEEQNNLYAAEVSAEGVEINIALDGATAELTNSETALLLLPQELTGAQMNEYGQPIDNGTYIKVTCKVYYQGHNAVQTQIIGENGEAAEIYIPLSSVWKAGYKYVYTLIFSKDIADPITINEELSVAEWYDGGNTDVPGEDDIEEPIEEIVIEGLRYSVANRYFYIDDVEDLTKMAELVNGQDLTYTEPTYKESLKFGEATYIQTTSIDFSNVEVTQYDNNGSTSNFTPIGISGYSYGKFGGVYSGQGHSITGLKFTQGSSQVIHAALFNMISGASISNLIVEGEISAQSLVAGIVAEDAGNSHITSCISNVDITMVGSARSAGGIIAKSNGTTISNCVNNGNIIQSKGADWVGGIVGESYGETTIIACVNNGNINGENNIGGLVGIDGGGVSIYASYNRGTVNATAADGTEEKPVGGLVGQFKGKMVGCYNLGEIQLNGNTYDQNTYNAVGAIAGVEKNEDLESAEAIKACYWGGNCKSDNGLGISGWAVNDEVMNAMNDALKEINCAYIFQPNDDSSLLIPVNNR